MRHANVAAKTIWDFGTFFRERLVFRSIPPLPESSSKTMGRRAIDVKNSLAMSLSVDVGTEGGRDDGINISWKLSRVDNVLAYLTRLGLPKDSGTSIAMDLQLREGVSPADSRIAALALKDLLTHQFSDELASNPQFRGLFVFLVTAETGGPPIIRVALTYKRHTSWDSWLAHSLTPFTLSDLLTDFSGQLSTSVTLTDISEMTYTCLDDHLFARVRTVSYRISYAMRYICIYYYYYLILVFRDYLNCNDTI